MKKIIVIISILVFLLSDVFSQCNPNKENIYSFTTNGVFYEIVKEKLNWTDAAACALHRGGFLAEINSKTEQDSVFFYVNKAGIIAANTVAPDGGAASYLWLGGNDIATEGDWIWDGDNSGSFVQFWKGNFLGGPVGGSYFNWGNEPDNWNDQDALGLAFTKWPLGVAGQWNDIKISNLLYYIIEYKKGTLVDNIEKNSFSVFPNPSSEFITVNVDSELKGLRLTIYDILGKVVLEVVLNSENQKIDISKFLPGIYSASLENELTSTFKFIKR